MCKTGLTLFSVARNALPTCLLKTLSAGALKNLACFFLNTAHIVKQPCMGICIQENVSLHVVCQFRDNWVINNHFLRSAVAEHGHFRKAAENCSCTSETSCCESYTATSKLFPAYKWDHPRHPSYQSVALPSQKLQAAAWYQHCHLQASGSGN